MSFGKIHRNLFGGVFVAFASIPSSLSIISDYLLPLIKNSLGEIIFGKLIFSLLSLMITIASIIWIKETIEDMDRTSRFMSRERYNLFIIKTIVIVILAIFCGLVVNRTINN